MQLISVVFQVGANGIGLLDPGSETNRVGFDFCEGIVSFLSFFFSNILLGSLFHVSQIEQGAKLDLPFWLAHELYLRQAVGVQLPAAYNQK